MFTTMRSCVARMNRASRSKVKVILRGHWKTLVRSKTSTSIKGFQNNLAQMFTIVRRSVAFKIYVAAAKVKVTLRGQSSDKNMKMCIGTIKLSFIEGLKNKWSLSWLLVKNMLFRLTYSRSRSQKMIAKVTKEDII
jgi:hypothetical protein